MKITLRICGAVLLTLASLAAPGRGAPAASKVALVIIEPAGEQGWSRLNRAFAYARQFKRADVEVQLFFDGAGVTWLTIADEAPQKSASPNGSGKKPPKGVPLSARIQNALTEMTTLGIPISASLNSAEKQGISAKLDGKRIKLVNTTNESNELPRLMSQGNQILIF